MPIRQGLAEYALISAFRDSRFRKIDKSELETLECGYVPAFLFASFVKISGLSRIVEHLILTIGSSLFHSLLPHSPPCRDYT
jgi:hypothetical protein